MSRAAPSPRTPYSKVTIRDVARRAGVTLTTVSSALNGRGRVSAETREQVRKIADELGYQPKLAAQMMRAHSTGHIGLILPGSDPQQVAERGHAGPILAHFIEMCEQRDVAYHIEYWDASGRDGFKPPRQLSNGLSDGVIVGGYIGDSLRDWLDARKVAWVSLGEPAAYSVLSAEDEGIFQATQRLAALGHRRIAYAGGPQIYLTHRLGLEGFRRAQNEFGLEEAGPGWTLATETSGRCRIMEQVGEWSAGLLAADKRPTAFVCHDAVIARSVIYQAMLMNLSVPRDLSVIGLGTAADAEKSPPPLTTIEVDFAGLVERAMDMLLQRLDGRLPVPTTRQVPPNLVMRATVAAAPGV